MTLVLSDKADAGGLRVARELGVEARAIPAAGIPDRIAYDQLLGEALAARTEPHQPVEAASMDGALLIRTESQLYRIQQP